MPTTYSISGWFATRGSATLDIRADHFGTEASQAEYCGLETGDKIAVGGSHVLKNELLKDRIGEADE